MNTTEYLDAVKKRLEIESDYALSKSLGVAKQTVSNYRNGKTHLDEKAARRVGEILNIHPGLVVLDMQRERARTSEEKTLWSDIYKGFLLLLRPAKGVAA